MNESAALEVVAVWAIESADGANLNCSDADRTWASHAAAAAVGERAAPDLFLARRARLVLERLHMRQPALRRAINMLAWRPWLSTAVVMGAFLVGLLADQVGDAQRVNVLAPPVLLLLLWNLAVYLAIAIAGLLPAGDGQRSDRLRRALARAGSGWKFPGKRAVGPGGPWMAMLAGEWARLAAPLYRVRAARVLHLAAAALAVGVIAGLYLRGLALEYRATWESTFLDPVMVHGLLSVVLLPGAWLGNLPLPELARVAAIRTPDSENAAYWLHLMALTLLCLVVLPRLALAALAWLRERRRAHTWSLQIDQPYFRRLLRGFHVEPTQVVVLPYGYTPAKESLAALEAILSRLLGGAATVGQGRSIGYGDEDDPALRKLPSGPGPVLVLFNLAATPESEAHVAFARVVKADCSASQPLVAVVDETSFRARAGDDALRLQQRRIAWQDMLAVIHVDPVFVDLSEPDLQATDAALDKALSQALNRPGN